MRMFRIELYRIFSRKTTWVAIIAALLFSFFYGTTMRWGEGTIDAGNAYMREEAIAKDKEITSEFAGPLTEDTVRAIWEKYGAPINYPDRYTTWDALQALAEKGGNDNYCNRFVAEWFGERTVGEDGQAVYVLPENLSENVYLSGKYYFAYLGDGWERFEKGVFEMTYVLVCLVIVIALCPMFSEDYAFRTADIILCAERGRFRLWWTRTAAGCCFATLLYWLACGMIFVQELAVYGAEGLKASCVFGSMSGFWPKDAMPVGRAIAFLYLAGWFSVLVLTLLVHAVSAGSRQSFSSMIKALGIYFGPFVTMRVILNLFPMGRVNMLLHYICYSMPFSYPGMIMEAPAGSGLEELLTVSALTAAIVGGILGARLYCRHQVKN